MGVLWTELDPFKSLVFASLISSTDPVATLAIFSSTGAWEIEVPRVECVNAIGAGDVCTGVFIHELAKARKERRVDGEAAAEAFAWGLAAASARCAPLRWGPLSSAQLAPAELSSAGAS